jgi:ubiquinone/menaquinone biosynthesis C-methylase UbiE
MFLSRRTTQAEYFDAERPLEELQQFYRALASVNSLFMVAEPFQRYIPRLLGSKKVRQLSLLDLGAGDGSLGQSLTAWATRKGWSWRIVNIDQNASALALNKSAINVAGSVLALPFHNESFDVVIASQMTHHLSDENVPRHLSEAWRVARHAVVISDLHRNAALYLSLWLLFLVTRFPQSFRTDAFLSVRRAWRVGELRRLARMAGLNGARTTLYFGARVVLQVRKDR